MLSRRGPALNGYEAMLSGDIFRTLRSPEFMWRTTPVSLRLGTHRMAFSAMLTSSGMRTLWKSEWQCKGIRKDDFA